MRPWALQISAFFLKCFLFWLLRHHMTLPVHSHHLTSHSASLMPREVGVPQASVCSCYLPNDSIQVTGFNSQLLHLQLLNLSYLCPGPYVRISKMIISIWMSLMNKSIHPKPLITLPSPPPPPNLAPSALPVWACRDHACIHMPMAGNWKSSIASPSHISFLPHLFSIPTAPTLF